MNEATWPIDMKLFDLTEDICMGACAVLGDEFMSFLSALV